MYVLKAGLFACLAAVAAISSASANSYPARPVLLVVPFPPGGSTTVVARSVSDKLAASLGQPVVIENRGGAGGTIGTRFVAKAAPDGYTILLSYTGTFAIGPTMYAEPGYDPRKDFAPIGQIGAAPSVLVVNPAVPVHSVAELIKYAKAAPTPLQFGSPGIGTVNHLAGELLASESSIKLQHIPYKGNGPALTDLLGNHIPMMFVPVPVAIGNVKAGNLRALAVSSARRSSLFPDLPTMEEQGIQNFDVALRYELVAPAGTPAAIIKRLNEGLNAALASDEVKKRLATDGIDTLPSSPEEYAKDLDRDEARWSPVIRKLGLKVQ